MAVEAKPEPLRRLTKRSQFLRAARGQRAQSRIFALQAVRADDVAFAAPGLGLTVNKKIGNSPERSRIKRRLRAAAAECRGEFHPFYDYVIVGRRGALYEPFDRLVTGLGALIARVHSENARPQRPAKRT